MSAIARTYTFTDGTDAFGSQVENEFNTIYNAWNNHDSGTSRWTVMDATTFKKASFTAFSILQIVSNTSVTDFSTTSGTFQTTNLTAAITPKSSSSTIIVMATGLLRQSVDNTQAIASLFRGSTNLGSATNGFSQASVNGGRGLFPWAAIKYDSPATTSSTTYSVKLLADGTNEVTFGNTGTQSMILIEVLA